MGFFDWAKRFATFAAIPPDHPVAVIPIRAIFPSPGVASLVRRHAMQCAEHCCYQAEARHLLAGRRLFHHTMECLVRPGEFAPGACGRFPARIPPGYSPPGLRARE